MFIQCNEVQPSNKFWTTQSPTSFIFKWSQRELHRLRDFLSEKVLIFSHDYILIKIASSEYEMNLVTDYSKIKREEHCCLDIRTNATSELLTHSAHAYLSVCDLLIRCVFLLPCTATENAE
jgi:hypothetical protein